MYKITRFFSKKKKSERKKNSLTDDEKKIVAGTGVVGTGLGMNVLGNREFQKEGAKGLTNDSSVLEGLKKKAEESGVKLDTTTRTGMGPLYSPRNNTVYTDRSKSAGALGHELGHAHYFKGKGKKSVGGYAHKAYMGTGGTLGFGVVHPMVGVSAGLHTGKRKARLEAKGEKESKFNRHAGWGTGAILAAPALISEGLASRKGIRMMKGSGATKKAINSARKELSGAFSTYAGQGVINAGLGELSHTVGYKREKSKIEKRKKRH